MTIIIDQNKYWLDHQPTDVILGSDIRAIADVPLDRAINMCVGWQCLPITDRTRITLYDSLMFFTSEVF